jgi:hypothetical protein
MPTLSEIYNDPKSTTKNPAILAKRAGVSQALAKRFLSNLGSAQVTKAHTAPHPDSYVPLSQPVGTYVGDVIFFKDFSSVNKGFGAIFTLINSNSRYAYCRPIKVDHLSHTSTTRMGVTSKKIADAMRSILEENSRDKAATILALVMDNGPENAGEFLTLLDSEDIEINKLEPRVHERLRRLDRFHRTLRLMIGEIMAQRNSHVYIDVFDDIVANYNSRPHRTLSKILGKPTSPIEVTESDELALREYDLTKVERIQNETPDITGKKVRILMSRTNYGTKSEKTTKSNDQTWSSEIYDVLERVGPNSFRLNTTGLDPRNWPIHSLLVVSGATVQQTPKQASTSVNRKVIAAQRLESRNISPEEQQAALSAPARPKREIVKPSRFT